MILKAFKEKSNKKYLNNTLSNRSVNVDNSKILSLGVILNIDEFDNFDLFRNLAVKLKIRPNKLKVVAFSIDTKTEHHSWDVCFNPNDFGWHGVIKNIELQTFLDAKFDALINYYSADILELKLLTAVSNASFKIGIQQSDARLNDLIINTKIKQFEVFKNELFKYLTILNKIKNEK